MNIWKVTIITAIAIVITGCAGPRYNGSAIAPELHQHKPQVVVIEDAETREGFRKTIENWLQKNNYQYSISPDGSKHNQDILTIEYVGHWNWDLALYLSRAKIEAFHQGQRVGEVTYKAPNTLNTNKFSNAEERIEYMLEVLFGKISDIEANRSI